MLLGQPRAPPGRGHASPGCCTGAPRELTQSCRRVADTGHADIAPSDGRSFPSVTGAKPTELVGTWARSLCWVLLPPQACSAPIRSGGPWAAHRGESLPLRAHQANLLNKQNPSLLNSLRKGDLVRVSSVFLKQRVKEAYSQRFEETPGWNRQRS